MNTLRSRPRGQNRLGTCRRLTDCVSRSFRPSGHRQETPRQSMTLERPSGRRQKTRTRCKTI
ncbi:hypothetical protein DPMN_128560 [Dreissena polymorpha]|uniref:Uncharacterized protein n=1 Tax=Dreissena polymorpha TaxID=45954 RepID=A0A9D4GZQ3_DREPO|nr:hypothetical protein DPMN_128560 [Dreissena polymorpha]